ncbi:MAG: homoserine dehydrogenase [Planctomycetales bacterium]|nr:homoserine dehydrogenase [Planctomycetales bacterium]
MDTTKVALVGMGTVGTGVARLLCEEGDRLAHHAGRRIELAKVVVSDTSKGRDIRLPKGVLTDDLDEVVADPEITTVAPLIGGLEPERTIVLSLLGHGKNIVTANKALLAEYGPELFDRARELGRSIAFEAAVAGGVPIIANISQCLSANQIMSLQGILNGTSNFILSQMESVGAAYADAVAEAQRLGYAEADPAMDVDGSDAAQKLGILAHLAFGARVHWRDIPRVGIDKLELADIQFADELGYRIRLLAVARLVDNELELHVSPTLVRANTPLADVSGAFNAVSVEGDAVGPLLFHGLGAGQMPTASAVVADLIDTVVGRTAITFRTLELWSRREAMVDARDFDQVPGRFYMRFAVQDHPGVMSEITGALGRNGVSIASIIQHESGRLGRDEVPLVLMTHQTTEGAAARAVREIDRLASVSAPSVRMRVHDAAVAGK